MDSGESTIFFSLHKQWGRNNATLNAAGEIITANECQNQDYFWAMRGGGGSTYGVVLTYTLQTIPSRPAAQYYTLLSGWDELVQVHREWPKIAMRGGMKTLHQDSMLKVKEGLTTMEEAIATVPPDL